MAAVIVVWHGTSAATSDCYFEPQSLRYGRSADTACRRGAQPKPQGHQHPTHDVAMDTTRMHRTQLSTALGATATGIAPVILFAQPLSVCLSPPLPFCATASTSRPPVHVMNSSLQDSPSRRRAVMQRSPRSDATESNGVPETPTASPRSEWRVCRVCKQLYDPAQNGPDSCLHHTAMFTGRLLRVEPTDTSDLGFFYDCCGATSVDAPGCTRSYHQPYE